MFTICPLQDENVSRSIGKCYNSLPNNSHLLPCVAPQMARIVLNFSYHQMPRPGIELTTRFLFKRPFKETLPTEHHNCSMNAT